MRQEAQWSAISWIEFASKYRGSESEFSADWVGGNLDPVEDTYEDEFARQVNVVSSRAQDGSWSLVYYALNAKQGREYMAPIGMLWEVRAIQAPQGYLGSEVSEYKCPIFVEFKESGSGGNVQEILVGCPKTTFYKDPGPGLEQLMYTDIISNGKIVDFFKELPNGTYRPADKQTLAHGAARLAIAAHCRGLHPPPPAGDYPRADSAVSVFSRGSGSTPSSSSSKSEPPEGTHRAR